MTMLKNLISEWILQVGGQLTEGDPIAYWQGAQAVQDFRYGIYEFRWVIKSNNMSYIFLMWTMSIKGIPYRLCDLSVDHNRPDMFEKVKSFINNPFYGQPTDHFDNGE